MSMPRAGSASGVFPHLSISFGKACDHGFGAERTLRRFTLCVLAVSLFVLSAALPSLAATDTVYFTMDNGGSPTPGTLRYWLANAAAGDTIVLSVTGMITVDPGTGPFVIRKNLSVIGPGAANLAISGGLPSPNACGVFVVLLGATATISGVTIENGNSANGGGIYNSGTLTVSNSTLSGNMGTGPGGGIFSTGTLTVSNSTCQATPPIMPLAAASTSRPARRQ